jgi:hypothetical protein
MKPCEHKAEARRVGAIRYSTGTPCVRGHMAERYASTGQCVPCGMLAQAKHSKTPKGIAYRRRWRTQDHVRAAERQYALKYSKRYLYDLKWDEYQALIAKADNKCEICKTEFIENAQGRKGKAGSAACIDHNHKTNKIRGVLCNRCNRALGLLKDDASVLAKAIEYLCR